MGIVRSRSRSRRDFEIILHLPQYKLSNPISQLWHMLEDIIKSVCKSDNNIQDLLISSVRNHARKSSINKKFQYRYA